MPYYKVYIPAYCQTFQALNKAAALEKFNESIDLLNDIDDEMMEVKIKQVGPKK